MSWGYEQEETVGMALARGKAHRLQEPNVIQETKKCILTGAYSMGRETKLRDCWRSAHLRLYGHVGVLIDPLAGTGFVLGTRDIQN